MYTKIQAMQDTLNENLTFATSYTSLGHSGTISSQRGYAFKNGYRHMAVQGYNASWVLTTPNGDSDTAAAGTMLAHRLDHNTQTVVTYTIPAVTGGAAVTVGAVLIGIRHISDNALISVVKSGTGFRFYGVVNGAPVSGFVDVASKFGLPAPGADDHDNDMTTTRVNLGEGNAGMVAHKCVYIKATDTFHEQTIIVDIGGGASVTYSKSFKRKWQGTLTPGYYQTGRVTEAGINHYLFTESPELNGYINNLGGFNPVSVSAIIDPKTGTSIWDETFDGSSGPSTLSTVDSDPNSVRLNQFMIARDYLAPDEGNFIGGRFICMITNRSPLTLIHTSPGGSIIHTSITRDTSPTGAHRTPRVVFGISPSGDILLGWKNTSTTAGEQLSSLVCYTSGGSEKWRVSDDDGANWYETLVESPLLLTVASSFSESMNIWCNFDGRGNVIFNNIRIQGVTTNGAMRAPHMRNMFSLVDGRSLKYNTPSTIPGVSNIQQSPLLVYYTFNEVTKACQLNTLVASNGSTYSSTNTTALSGAFKRNTTPIRNKLNFKVMNALGETLKYNSDYSVDATVDGWFELAEGDDYGNLNIPITQGAEYKMTFAGKFYTPLVISGTYDKSITPQTIEVYLQDKDWTRRDYTVSTQQDVLDISKDPMGNYNFANDIDMSGVPYETPYLNQDDAFMGVINGNGYTLSNLQATGPSSGSYGGLIGVAQNAQFVDITVLGAKSEASAGHGLGLLAGFYLREPLFAADEEIPATYTELDPLFKNITIENSVVKTQWGHSGIGMLFGVFTWRGYLDTLDYVFEEIVLRRNTTIGTDSGSSNVGPVVGQMDIMNLNGGGGGPG